jgi:hypothetical protein
MTKANWPGHSLGCCTCVSCITSCIISPALTHPSLRPVPRHALSLPSVMHHSLDPSCVVPLCIIPQENWDARYSLSDASFPDASLSTASCNPRHASLSPTMHRVMHHRHASSSPLYQLLPCHNASPAPSTSHLPATIHYPFPMPAAATISRHPAMMHRPLPLPATRPPQSITHSRGQPPHPFCYHYYLCMYVSLPIQ